MSERKEPVCKGDRVRVIDTQPADVAGTATNRSRAADTGWLGCEGLVLCRALWGGWWVKLDQVDERQVFYSYELKVIG